MPSIGDITGRIVIQDVGSPAAIKFGENLEKASKTIMASMSRATLATETAVREIASKLAKLKTETKETAAGKGLVADLDSLIKKRAQELSALKAGPAAIEALNEKRYQEAQALKIAAAQVDAGVSAESYLGRTIAANIKTLDRYEQELDQVAKAQAKATQKTADQIAAYRKLSDAGRSLTTHVTLPLLALGTGAVKIASDFESSFAGVRKTVDATEEEFAELALQIRALASGPNAVPIDVNQLNAVAEAAGQLGIAKGDILDFTRTMADLGETTNLTAEEAATATAQFQNIFGAAGKEVDRFGSTLVALGNAGASTERDIISMGLRIAGAGVQLGLSQGQVLAYASALSSMGIEAEAGGSAISKVMIDIALAVSKGGQELDNFSAVAGMSVDEFKAAFEEDAAGAVASFIEGLGRLKESGGDVIGVLDAMGITEVRMRDALLRSAGAGDLLRDSLNLQAKAWSENTALAEEARKRYDTFQSQLKIFWNQLKDVAITFGTALLPALRDSLEALKPWIERLAALAEWFAKLDPAGQKLIIAIVGIAAATGPAVFVTGQLLLAWTQIVAVTPKVVLALNSTSKAMVGVRLGLIGIVGVAIFSFMDRMIDKFKEATDAATQFQLRAAEAMGGALKSAQAAAKSLESSPGGKVSRSFFEEATQQVTKLNDLITETQANINRFYRDTAQGGVGLDPKLRNMGALPIKPSELIEQENLLSQLIDTQKRLVPVLTRVSVEGEKVDKVLGENDPFKGLNLGGDKATDTIADLTAELLRQAQALKLLQEGVKVERIENLVEAARELGKTNLLDPLVKRAADLKDGIDAIATAFEQADQAKKKLADAEGNLDKLIVKQFDQFAGSNDPAMQALIKNLKQVAPLIEVWNIELDETQIKFNEIYERLSYIAEGIAYDLVYNWRRAWEENESIVDATVDTLRDTFLNVLQDIVSQWLSTWFKAMAAWLARWIATQRAAQVASATTGATSGFANSSQGLGNFAFGYGGQAASGAGGAGSSAGMSANALAGWALAAWGLYVVYKGFVERERAKFATITIENGQYDVTASRGQKYLDGVAKAAESILQSIAKFVDDWNVQVERLGTVIVTASKSGWNVSIPGSTGKLFSSMEEAISYAQVLALKYAEFADGVSLLVRSVISSSKAISIEELASDISFAKELETQNLEQSAAAIRDAMDLAIAQWKRAEDLFLSFYDRNLPAFAEAATSILTRLGNSIWATYNQLAGIEEDPDKAWERKRAQYRVERMMVEAQLKLWQLDTQARIANFKTFGPWLGGLNNVTRGTLKHIQAWVAAAEVLDPALQALLDIEALIKKTLEELPPLDLPETAPKGKGGGKGNKQRQKDLREDLRDEIAGLEAEAKGPLHRAFFDLNANIEAFRERAKEAKLPAAELAKGVEILTAAFQKSILLQARAYAGLETDISKRLAEIEAFFDEARELGPDKTGISNEDLGELEAKALAKVGDELAQMIAQFVGLIDPMLAINMRANELRESVIAYGEAAGWSAEQIAAAMAEIDKGIEVQRLQGINAALGGLFNILKQAGLYQEEALEFERQSALLQLQIIEAQLRFYGALTTQTEEWIAAARDFINSDKFGRDGDGIDSGDDIVRVKIVNPTDQWDDIIDRIKSLVDSWREAVQQFADSTADLLTDEGVTNLTQEQQLAFARAQVEELAAKAQAGDLEALQKLAEARAEYLKELRESEAAGFGFDKGFDWVMDLTAEVLKNAKAAEDAMIAKELEKNIQAWAYVMDKLADQLDAAFYENTQDLIDAIYDAIGSVPSFGRGGVVMSGPRLVRVAEYVPEAIVPLDRLANMIPYRGPGNLNSHNANHNNQNTGPLPVDFFSRHTALSNWSNIEHTNRVSASALKSIRDDVSANRRRGR